MNNKSTEQATCVGVSARSLLPSSQTPTGGSFVYWLLAGPLCSIVFVISPRHQISVARFGTEPRKMED